MFLPLLVVAASTTTVQERRPPEFRSDVRMIRLDVSVVDRSGRPAAGLRPEDFTITEDGRLMEVALFEAVETGWKGAALAGGAIVDPDVSVAPPPRRILLLLDSGALSAGQLLRARDSLARYLRESTADGDWVRLLNLSTGNAWDGDIPRDRARLEAAVRSLGRRESPWSASGDGGRIEDRVERLGRRGEPSQAENTGRFLSTFAQASDLLGTLESILLELGGVTGRKALVLVSPGFPQLRDLDRHLQRVATLAREAATAVYFLDAVGLDGLEPEDGRLKPAFEVAWARSGGAQDLAEATGGFTSRFANHLDPALSRIAGEMHTYYVIGYVPSRPEDGHFRSVKVRVRVPGLEARTKKGYLAGK